MVRLRTIVEDCKKVSCRHWLVEIQKIQGPSAADKAEQLCRKKYIPTGRKSTCSGNQRVSVTMWTMTVLTNSRIWGIGVTVHNSFTTWVIEPLFDYTGIIISRDLKTPGYSAADKSLPKHPKRKFSSPVWWFSILIPNAVRVLCDWRINSTRRIYHYNAT